MVVAVAARMWSRALLLVLVTALHAVGESAHQDNNSNFDTQLKVGRSIDLFTRYGYLSLSMKVVPRNDSVPTWIFREPTVDIFNNVDHLVRSRQAPKNVVFEGDFHMEFCDNLNQLLQAYFRDFSFEKLKRPWRAFTGSWLPEAIARNLGINSSFTHGDYCYVLVRLSRFRDRSELGRLPENVSLVEMVQKEMDGIKVGDYASVLMFIKKFGSHYIKSYVTGNSLYQVFVYKRSVYQNIKSKLQKEGVSDVDTRELLLSYFSPWYAEHMGKIKVSSGNKTVENWAQSKLRVRYYIFSYPCLLKIHGDPHLLGVLNNLLGNEALLQIKMNAISPAFKDPVKKQWFNEVLENMLDLWEVNL
ncbi:torso-like protein isoform X2 [Agrilus planipennis]|uniref:Torso-like protein isoform X2 n=1 Tax=Agrilus planipennis TaxID=224129 RepID=A0A1W4XTA4_AGRPL|nr:torso-like protein isoform X2 [Agrilus planipennis]